MKRRTTPRSTRRITRDATHSSSTGREAARPAQSGSSASENAGSNTCSPTLPASGEMPWSTALPDSACVTGSISAERPEGVKTTGSAPWGGGRDDRERALEPPVDGADEAGEQLAGREVGPLEPVADREHVVPRDAPHLGAHADRRRAVGGRRAGAVRHARLRRLTLDGDIDLAAVPRQPLDQRATDPDQVIEGGVGGAVEERGDLRRRGGGGKDEVQLLPELGRGEGALDELAGRGVYRRAAGHANAAAVTHAQVRPRLFGNAH